MLGYDDEISKMRREHIREHYYDYVMPYQSIYETEKKLEEFEMDKLLSQLLGTKVKHGVINKTDKPQIAISTVTKPNEVDFELMQQLPKYNVAPIWGINSWRGSTDRLSGDDLELMKKAGKYSNCFRLLYYAYNPNIDRFFFNIQNGR